MDKIGSSYIAWPDFIICGAALALFYSLTNLPPDSLICRVLAVISGCIIVSIIAVIVVANNLTDDGVHELSMIGMFLAFGLFQWNDARVKSKRSIAPEST